MNAVGIDVSKGKSMVCVMRPFGEVVLEPFEVLHTAQSLNDLAGKLKAFSFCSNARSFDRPTVAKPGEKIKVPIFIRRKGADAFRPVLAAGGSLMAYKCLSLCDFFIVQQFFKLCHIRFVLLEDFYRFSFGVGIVR